MKNMKLYKLILVVVTLALIFGFVILKYKCDNVKDIAIVQDEHIEEERDGEVYLTIEESKQWHEGISYYGVQYDVVIHNNTSHELNGWSFSLNMPAAILKISDFWNIEVERSEDGTVMSAVPLPEASIVESKGSQSFGFITITPEPFDLKELTFTATPVYKMQDFQMFYVLVAVSAIAVVFGVSAIAVECNYRKIHKQSLEDKEIIRQAMMTFSNFIDAKDDYTRGHSTRVADYSRELAEYMRLAERECELIYYIALLHDIGKIFIPDEILNKPGRLTNEERKIMETHTSKGAQILKDFTAIDGIADGAKYHHERFDGKGYPDGISGTDIPLYARIIGVADAYDAMSSDRVYRPKLSKEVIYNELINNAGKQFDPEIVGYMLDILGMGTKYEIEQ